MDKENRKEIAEKSRKSLYDLIIENEERIKKTIEFIKENPDYKNDEPEPSWFTKGNNLNDFFSSVYEESDKLLPEEPSIILKNDPEKTLEDIILLSGLSGDLILKVNDESNSEIKICQINRSYKEIIENQKNVDDIISTLNKKGKS